MSGFHYWKNEIAYLKKVGPKRAELLSADCGIHTFGDLLQYFPRKYIDRSRLFRIREIDEDTTFVTLSGRISNIRQVKVRKGSILNADFSDGTGKIDLVWFQGVKFLKESLKEGEEVILFGQPKFYAGGIQISHPEMERKQGDADPVHSLKILPYYPSTEKLRRAGLDSRGIRELIHILLDGAADSDFPEIIPEYVLARFGLMSRREALHQIHFPEDQAGMEAAQRRLKFEEFFFFQLLVAQKKQASKKAFPAPPFPVVGELFNGFYKTHLPFELTGAQKRVLKEIRSDLAKPSQMNRLVQGDVGSGKTMVAFMACLIAADNGYQSAFMAPTEILAEQHFRNFSRYGEACGIRVALLSGSTKKAAREKLVQDLTSGAITILIGTHALIEPYVKFKKLGLTIVDEQHKFGVRQRAELFSKAEGYWPHNMVMTATPIPRTLSMAVYGDLDVSVIDELPPGRSPVKTLVRGESERLRVLGFVKQQVSEGRQAYFVYPLIEESEKSDLLAVMEGYEALKRYFTPPDQLVAGQQVVGIVHGRQKAEDKEYEMQRFKRGELKVLVSTTVIEVGVDVPNATVMVIENAERFGLSQLHQLRGRVGRGAAQSWCILMIAPKRHSKDAMKRLHAMVETNDGFKISEYDLQLRGPGDFLGTRQSGIPEFHLLNVAEDKEEMEQARAAAFQIIADDPELEKSEHTVSRHYLQKFMRDKGLLGVVA